MDLATFLQQGGNIIAMLGPVGLYPFIGLLSYFYVKSNSQQNKAIHEKIDTVVEEQRAIRLEMKQEYVKKDIHERDMLLLDHRVEETNTIMNNMMKMFEQKIYDKAPAE